MQQASSYTQRPIAYPDNSVSLLTAAGFTDINHRTVRIPLEEPRDLREWELERRFKGAMCVADRNGTPSRGFESLSMSLFTRQLRMPPSQVNAMCAAARTVCYSRQLPLYFNMYVTHFNSIDGKEEKERLTILQTYLDCAEADEITPVSM